MYFIQQNIFENVLMPYQNEVDAKINDDIVRVTGKKKDDLQSTIALVRSSKIEQPLQYENFRD